MLKKNSELRAIARETLKGNWTPAVLAAFVYMIIAGLAGGIPFINYITTFLVSLPLGMSVIIVYLKFLRGDKEKAVSNIFAFFNDYGSI
jgi:uncharacterized membrane protein